MEIEIVALLLLTRRLFAGGVDFVSILVFCPDKKTGKRRGSALVDHGLNLPDHATFTNAGIRERRTAVACVVEKIVLPVTLLGIGRSLQRALRIELEQNVAIFRRQWRRTFPPEIDAHPPVVSGGNQEALGWTTMEQEIEGSWAEESGGDDKGKAEDCEDDERGFAHSELLPR
jgi:hypothetical protein